MGYITKQGLQNLTKYQYRAGKVTWFERKINYFWEWIIKFIPKNIAPNLLTVIGWCCILLSYLNMLRYDLTFDKKIPSSCFFLASFFIFCYITLDAIDGKQARRTKGGSPLGQLFDHGCDSFTLSFLILGLCQALQIQKNAVFVFFIVTQMAFATATWTQNHTGVLNTQVGQFGIIEGQHLCIIVHIITGIYGQSIWQIKPLQFIPNNFLLAHRTKNFWLKKLLNIKLGNSVVYIFSVITLILAFKLFSRTLKKLNNKFQAVSQYLSSFLLIVIQICWCNTPIFKQYSGLILINFAFIASLIISKLIICTITKMDVQNFHYQLIPSMISTILLLYLEVSHTSEESMKILFWILFIIDIIWVFTFLVLTVSQITSFLGIRCFSLQKCKRVQKNYNNCNETRQKQK